MSILLDMGNITNLVTVSIRSFVSINRTNRCDTSLLLEFRALLDFALSLETTQILTVRCYSL